MISPEDSMDGRRGAQHILLMTHDTFCVKALMKADQINL